MRGVIVSGRSGSGKSITLRVLEDLGFYCIDNLPIGLLSSLETQINVPLEKIAVSIDARNISIDFERFKQIIEHFQSSKNSWQVIYLDADNATLLKRFSETRRKHPLTTETVSLKEAIIAEKKLLEPLASLADLMIDTRALNTNQLSERINERFADNSSNHLSILFQSFGYKHGIPLDADFIFDLRMLPNPYWHEHLQKKTGQMKEVIEFFKKIPKVEQAIKDIIEFLEKWIKNSEFKKRKYLTVAIGCTGGKHRSVFAVEFIKDYFFNNYNYQVLCRHRDVSS